MVNMEVFKSLNIDKPIAFFDLETTGLDISKDRIIQIAITKLMPNGTRESRSSLINPMIPISKKATEIHGITNEMLVEKPKFNNLAKSIYDFIKDCYIGGYNNNWFDNLMLQEEFLRCGIDFDIYNTISIDACALFKNFEKRDLSSAVKFYCNREMENAHDAISDINSTVDVFLAQLEKYEELKGKNLQEIAKICKPDNQVDYQNKIVIDEDGDYCWNFGKAAGKKIKNETGFGGMDTQKRFP